MPNCFDLPRPRVAPVSRGRFLACLEPRLVVIQPELRDNRPTLWHHVAVAVLPDTHRLVSLLVKRGFSPEQAGAITDVIQEIDLSLIATKSDVRELEIRIMKWMIPLMIGQAAVFGLIVKWLVG